MAKNILKQLTPEERMMIKVRTMGSASLFSMKGVDVQHYVSEGDLVPWADPFNRLKAMFSSHSNVHVIPRKSKGLPMTDHFFNSETYQEKLKDIGDEIRRFRNR